MTRMITAMFDTRAEADAAADHLARDLGLQRAAVQVHGGEAATGATPQTPASTAADDVTFWSALRDLFVPDEDRPTYAEGIRRGSFLITVDVDDTAVDRAMDLLEAHGAVDLDTREAQWRTSGWTGQHAMGRKAGATDKVIPAMEEPIQGGKRDVERGRAGVRSYIVERPADAKGALLRERAIEAVKVDDGTTTKGTDTARLGTRHGTSPDGTSGNPPGTMASRATGQHKPVRP